MVLTSFSFLICLLICFSVSQQNLTCSFSNFPFMIGIKETFSFRHVCAGTLVKPDTVLTLASCIMGRKEIPGYFTAVAGPSLIGKIGSQRSIAKEIVIHSGFDRTRYAFDVGLLILQHKFQLSHSINVVKVPEEFVAEDFGKRYTKAVAIGWGPYHPGKRIIDDNRYLFNPTLKCVEVDLLDEKNCKKLRKGFGYEPNRICAWVPQGGEESCQGDAGGPLLVNKVQVGIVSIGYGCDSSINPAFYERLDRVLTIFKNSTESDVEFRSSIGISNFKYEEITLAVSNNNTCVKFQGEDIRTKEHNEQEEMLESLEVLCLAAVGAVQSVPGGYIIIQQFVYFLGSITDN